MSIDDDETSVIYFVVIVNWKWEQNGWFNHVWSSNNKKLL